MKGTFRYMFEVFIWSIYYYDRLSSVLSMNAAVSASVVLASRLSTNLSVFALVLFSILSFALFPILRRRLQVKPFPKNASFSYWLLVPSVIMFKCGMASDHSRIVVFGCSSSRKPISHSYVDIFFHSILCDIDSPGHLNLGTKIQEVRVFFLYSKNHISNIPSINSIIRGPWDVAVPKVK